MKKLFFNILLIVLPFLLLEAVFRLLPVNSPPYLLPVNAENPVARMQPGLEYTYSKGWNFAITASKRSNNYGYNNREDYDPAAVSPLLAVIGDSYVQANQVDAGKTAAELLADESTGNGRVYSIGLSGAPLSQYLIFAKFASQEFSPDAMVFVVVGNDFDESLLGYKRVDAERFHYFRETEAGLELIRKDYRLPTYKKLLRQSAFIRYVMLNLELKATLQALQGNATDGNRKFAGNTLAEASAQRLADAKRATDAFLAELPVHSGLATSRILFIVDGMRPQLYTEHELAGAGDSFYAQMREYFTRRAQAAGYEVVDMQPVFIRDFRANGRYFEFPTDGHWNEAGHTLVAQQVMRSRVYRELFHPGIAPAVHKR